MKINDLCYNATGARYGYNGTHEQDLEVNADGNYVDFGNFGYDTRVVMRRNQEPMRIQFPHLSTYSIFNSNPIMFSAPSGNWPYWIHDDILDMAFLITKILSENQVQILKQASLDNDTTEIVKEGVPAQHPSLSYVHSMRDGVANQTKDEAKDLKLKFVKEMQIKFIVEEDFDKALISLGYGIHTLTDEQSPSHKGFQHWDGLTWYNPITWLEAIIHSIRELNFLGISNKEKTIQLKLLLIFIMSQFN